MASKGSIITSRIFIWLTVIIVIGIMGVICYACSCNIRASTFDDIEQREGLINLYGCVFWGYPMAFLAVLSGGALIALLTLADKNIKNITTTNVPVIDTSSK